MARYTKDLLCKKVGIIHRPLILVINKLDESEDKKRNFL